MKILATTLLITLLFFPVKGQTVSPLTARVIPPGPSAAALGNYGLVPVNMHTGNTDVRIPLYEFKTKNLSVPISLSYNSSAIHLDETATWVGMHWSLNAGGVITRIVRDQPDLLGNNTMPYPEDFSIYDETSFNYVLFNGPNPDALDTEPDLFTYNFMGYTGRLVFDRDDTPVTMPRNDLVFEVISGYDFSSGFIVTTPDGIKYSFEEIERTTITGSGEGTYSVPTAWYLKQIRHPLGDTINLTYEPDNYNFPISASTIVTKLADNINPDPCPYGDCPPGYENTTLLIQDVSGKRLKSLESMHNGSVIFNASIDRSDILGASRLYSIDIKDTVGSILKSFALDYVFSDNTAFDNPLTLIDQHVKHRMFLTKVREKDKLGNDVKQYSLEYDDINALPARLSYARDHWGYFNGADNLNPFPEILTFFGYNGQPKFPGYNANRDPNGTYAKKGLLKKITYPTGGSSEFFYEGNSYYGSHQEYPGKSNSSIAVSGVQDQNEDIVSSTTITSGVEQYIILNVTCAYKDGYSSTDGHGKWIVYNQLGSPVNGGDIMVGESKTQYVHLLGEQQYTIAVIAQGPLPDNTWANNTTTTLNFQHYATPPQTISENIETGGIRIASITNHDPVSGHSEITNYNYASHNQLTKSSGIKMGMDPTYTTTFSFEKACFIPDNPMQCEPFSCSYMAIHSSGINSLFRQNGNNIYYEYVTITRGTNPETGMEEHQFIVSDEVSGTLVWGDDDIPGTPMSNINWDNGLEKAIRYYKKEGSIITLLKKVENEYTKDNRYQREIPGLSFRTNYWSECYGMEIADYFTCNLSQTQQTGHQCFGHQVGDTIPIPTGILKMVDAIEYLNISHWFYLSKQIDSTYDENGLNPVVQEIDYFYDNPAHTQLSRQVTTTSTGKSMESKYKYAPDYALVAGDAIELMANHRNMISIPIEHIQKIDGQVIDASATYFYLYPGMGNDEFIAPKDIYRYETKVPGNGFTESPDGKTFPSYTKKATEKYDNNGNIIEISKEGDVANAYIWGYGKQFPIAEVVNASSSDIFYISFEESEGIVDYNNSKTGNKIRTSAYNKTIPDLNNGSYYLTYWKRTNGIWTNVISLVSATSNSISIDIPASPSIPIDEVRLYPLASQMTTYTYDPIFGMTSQTDPNGITTYYEYDSSGWLKCIRDQNRNILKTYDYHYTEW
jgi:YD repeat-containing protein